MANPLTTKKGIITYKNGYMLLLALIWTRTSIVSYFFSALRFFPIMDSYVAYLKIILFIVASMLGMPYLINRLKAFDLGVLVFVVLAYLFNILCFEQTSEYLITNAIYILGVNFSVYFIGRTIDSDDFIGLLYRCSQLSLCTFLLSFVLFGFSPEVGRDTIENMGLAYRILPHACMIAYYSIKKGKIIDIVLSLVGAFLVLACGVRGAIISLLAFFFVYIICFYNTKHKSVLVIGLVGFSVAIYTQFNAFAIMLISFLKRYGLSTRVVETLLEGTTLEDAPRKRINEWMFEAIQVHPYRGYGIAGDRNLIPNVIYAHSFWLEMWISYGLIFGTAFMIAIGILITIALLKGSDKQKGLIIVMIFGGGLFKLLISSSYLLESEFFMLLGYCVKVSIEYKCKRIFSNNRTANFKATPHSATSCEKW